jgi:hypothetical protein
MVTAPSLQPPGPALAEQQLQQLVDDLASLSARLDAVVADPALGGGLAVMGLDQASQAVHLALIEVRDCIRLSPDEAPVPAAS